MGSWPAQMLKLTDNFYIVSKQDHTTIITLSKAAEKS